MTRDSGISNRLTTEEEGSDRAAHPPKDAPPHTAGDAPGAVAGAFGAQDGVPDEDDDQGIVDEAELDDDEVDDDEVDDDEVDDDDDVDNEPPEGA